MLSAREFAVGALADAKPLSLMLPRTRYEATFLIGQVESQPTAVFLGGNHNFLAFECSKSTNWRGLLVPNIRIEVDETSLFDPQSMAVALGTVVRMDTRLAVSAKFEHHFSTLSTVALETDLPPLRDLGAGFSRWRIVIGEGPEKRVLREIDTGQKLDQP